MFLINIRNKEMDNTKAHWTLKLSSISHLKTLESIDFNARIQ